MSDSWQPHGLYSPWNSLGQNTGMGSLSLFQGIFPTQGSNPGLWHLQADSVPAEPWRKLKNTGVGSLSLLQWIFRTQESNQGLLHYRQMIYQLRYQGSPFPTKIVFHPKFKAPTGSYSFFPGLSPVYTWGTHVNQLLFVFLLFICLLLQGSQLRAQKGRGKIIFPPLRSSIRLADEEKDI